MEVLFITAAIYLAGFCGCCRWHVKAVAHKWPNLGWTGGDTFATLFVATFWPFTWPFSYFVIYGSIRNKRFHILPLLPFARWFERDVSVNRTKP